MEKEHLISFRITKIVGKNGKILYGLEVPKEEGSKITKRFSVYSNLEQLVDGIYDYFEYNFFTF